MVPLRWRLTALYTLLLAGFLIVLDIFVYVELRSGLLQGQQAILSADATSLLATFPLGGNGAGDPGLTRRVTPGVVYQLYDPRGAVIAGSSGPRGGFPTIAAPTPQGTPASPPFPFPPDPKHGLPTLPARAFDTVTATGPDGVAPWLVLTVPVNGRGQASEILRVATSLAPLDRTLADLTRLLAGGSVGIIVLALLSGPTVAAGALKPLGRMAGTAERLAEGDLTQRTALRHGDDEVGNLARSFDHMAARLEQSFAEQQETEERLRRFAADASHELRTPLTALRGYVDVLLRGAKDDPVDVGLALQAMQREALRMEHLTTDLLDLTRLDAGQAGERVPCRFDEIVAQVLTELPAGGPAVNWGRREPVLVSGNPAALRRVVANLLENARRYTPAGGTVCVSVFSEGADAVLEVRDTGIGIAMADLPHIFERFYRGDSARSRATGGSGLGLAIVKAIVEAHRGTVAAASDVGSGSAFVIRLPVQTTPAVRNPR